MDTILLDHVNDIRVEFKCTKCGAIECVSNFITFMNFKAMQRFLTTKRCRCGNTCTVLTASYIPGYRI